MANLSYNAVKEEKHVDHADPIFLVGNRAVKASPTANGSLSVAGTLRRSSLNDDLGDIVLGQPDIRARLDVDFQLQGCSGNFKSQKIVVVNRIVG